MRLFRKLRRTGARRNERGAALVMITLSLVAVVGTTGVIVDGGNAFSTRRQMQNAADSAAMAGARALDHIATNAENGVWTAVVNAATTNGADSANVTCNFMSDVLADLGACPTVPTGTASTISSQVSAVKVTVGTTKNTTFTRAVGINNFTARATATAQIESLAAGTSPFLLCATGINDARSGGLLYPYDGQANPILNADSVNSINPGAVAHQDANGNWLNTYGQAATLYALQDSNVPTCGQNANNFKGLSLNFNTFALPGPWDAYNGNHGANVSSTVVAGANACRGGFTTGCIVLVPLCHADPDPLTGYAVPVQGKLYCERFGGFEVVDVQGQSRIAGYLVNNIEVTGGQGGGHAYSGEARIIKLSA